MNSCEASAVIVLLGAEFTQAWMKHYGRTIEPEEGAIRVVKVKERLAPTTPVPSQMLKRCFHWLVTPFGLPLQRPSHHVLRAKPHCQ